MATYKWCYDTNKWYTLYKRPFYNIVKDIKRIYKILGRVAKYLGNRCRRDKNLYDLDSAEDARYNLELINDCSPEANRLGISAHHHDSRHLRRDKNLSDLNSAEDARYNLGLINDCSPEANRLGTSAHHHDARYFPLFYYDAQANKSAKTLTFYRKNGTKTVIKLGNMAFSDKYSGTMQVDIQIIGSSTRVERKSNPNYTSGMSSSEKTKNYTVTTYQGGWDRIAIPHGIGKKPTSYTVSYHCGSYSGSTTSGADATYIYIPKSPVVGTLTTYSPGDYPNVSSGVTSGSLSITWEAIAEIDD